MKKFVLTTILCAVAGGAMAEGYVGVVRSKGSVAYDCNSGLDCKKAAELMKFYAGSKIDDRNKIDLAGIAKVDAIEVAYWRGIKPSASGLTKVTYYDGTQDAGNILPTDPLNNNFVPVKYTIGFDALILAAVVRAPLLDDFSAFVKGGVAYVNATKRYEINGQSNKSTTAAKFKPYLALGLEYNVANGLSLTGAFDYSSYEVDGTKGAIKAFGLGAEYSY
jgi:opacity protein-like surface antigen